MYNRRGFLRAVGIAPAAAAAQGGGYTYRDASRTSVELVHNGRPVFAYNYGMTLKPGAPESFRRACYLHPVYTPGGVIVTDDFPKDHYHHRGISWMWPVVRVDGREYDLWAVRGIRDHFVRWLARDASLEAARLACENAWRVGQRSVVKETVDIGALPGELRFTLTFEALDGPIGIRGTSDANKGYGGFSFRFAPRENTQLRTDKGTERKDTDMARHPWAELGGEFAAGHAAARVYDDPGNPGYPNGWCLRHYGFLGVNYPGLQFITLTPAKPLVLKYRVTLS